MTTSASLTEKTLAEVLADLLRVDRVPVGSHLFDDLGADSLMMAQFCARSANARTCRRYPSRTSTSTPPSPR